MSPTHRQQHFIVNRSADKHIQKQHFTNTSTFSSKCSNIVLYYSKSFFQILFIAAIFAASFSFTAFVLPLFLSSFSFCPSYFRSQFTFTIMSECLLWWCGHYTTIIFIQYYNTLTQHYSHNVIPHLLVTNKLLRNIITNTFPL